MDQLKQEICDFWESVKVNNEKDRKYGVDSTGWRKEAHIPYIADYNPMHVLNLYYPEHWNGADQLPVIIDIHGGGWAYGTVDDSERYLGWLASQGYAVMGMNYRLLPETDLQGIVSDIYASLYWLECYGEARGFDMDQVLLTGDSAGGHLTTLIACIQQSEELQKNYGVAPFHFPLRALCVSCTCSDTDHLYLLGSESTKQGQDSAKAYKELLLGERGKKAPWGGTMSIAETLPGITLPPLFVIGSEVESLHFQTRRLLELLEENRQSYETLIWKKEDGPHLEHVFNINHWEWRESLISNRQMLEFFRRSCGLVLDS